MKRTPEASTHKHVKEPIAIIGQSVLFPSSYDSTDFWKNIVDGKDLISDVPASHWLIEDYYDSDIKAPDKTYGKRGGFLPYVDFDSLGWGVPPSIIEATDSTQLLALMVAKQCLEDAAQGTIDDLDKSNMSVILGVTSAQKLLGHMTARLQRPIWENAMRQVGLPESEVQQAAQRIADHYVPWQESTFPGLLGNVVAGRIANRLDLGGTNCVTDAACASAFSAISMAINELYLGDSDVVIAGGADTMSDILMHMCFSKTPALSKTGDVRPFSDQADGTLLGEGIALFAFKRLADAERDGDQIYGVLKGLGSSSDGRSKSVYAPLAEGQAKAYRRAYANAGVEANTIELLEAHGTGTKAGDAAEFKGLQSVFSDAGADIQSIALGSVKSQIGHTKATAGAAGFFKALMALRSGILPPTIKVAQPNPNLNIQETPLYINTESRPWVRSKDHPRRAGVSAFGFGGSNFHILLEEYRGPNAAKRLRVWECELCLYSAQSVEEISATLSTVLNRDSKVSLSRLAWESQQNFDASAPIRLSLVSASRAQLIDQIATAIDKGFAEGYSLPSGVHVGVGQPWSGKKAFLFPGQGAQTVNMGSKVAQSLPQALEVWDFSAELDNRTNREPLHKKVFPTPAFSKEERAEQQTELTKTQWAQPAIGVASMALLNVLDSMGLQADCCAGHSYGELTALYYAKSYKAQHFVQVSQKRGELMNEAARLPGAMTAVKASAKKLQPKLDVWNAEAGLDVVIANHNSPKQSVLSGTVEDIEKIESLLSDSGMFAQRLGVATAFHSKVVAGSVAPFEQYLSSLSLSAPKCPVYANRTAKPYESSIPELISTLSKQISSPVRFVETIENMAADGVTLFVEVGPRNILGKLTKSILRKKPVRIVSLDRPGKSDLFGLLDGLGQLASLGIQSDWSALWQGYAEPINVDELPKPKMAISINGANYNKPYPPKEGASGRAKPNPERAIVQTTAEVKTSNPTPKTVSNNPASPNHSTHQESPQRQGATMSNPQSNEWLRAFQQAQQQTAAAHSAYQQAMSNAHIAYLQAAQASLTSLAALAGGQPIPAPSVPSSTVTPMPVPTMSAPTMSASIPPPVAVAPMPAPSFAPVASNPASAPMVDTTPVSQTPQPSLVSTPAFQPVQSVSTSPSSIGSVDVLSLLMDVVAEKTGYPSDALDLSMSLEGDLGIDSIKRVEILSAVQEKAPELPEVDGSQMAQLQTLGEIVEFLGGANQESINPGSTDSISPSSIGSVDVLSLLMDVVAEKTGYPSDALDLSMSLEGDLGIDSIKRVEILSAVQEKAPELPEVDGSQMAQLQTLGEIVGFLQGEHRDFSQAEASEMGVSANSNVDTFGTKTQNSQPVQVEERGSSVEDSTSFESFETLWTPPASQDVHRWIVQNTPRSASGLTHPALTNGQIALLGDEDLTSALAIQLQKSGVNASVVEANDAPWDTNFIGLVDLRPLEVESVEQAMKASQECFELAASLVQAHPTSPKVFIRVTELGGDFGFQSLTNQQALVAGGAGVVRTAQQEWKNSHCKNIDVPMDIPVNRLARMVAEEIMFGGMDMDVALTVDEHATVKRSVLAMVETEASGTPIEFFEDDILVVSGGARGVTADCIVRLAERLQQRSATIPTFVLLGRTVLSKDPHPTLQTQRELIGAVIAEAKAENKIIKPAGATRAAKRILACREIEATLQRLRSFGAKAQYHSVDVSDAEAVSALYRQLDQSKIVGIVHGAGVLADKNIADKSVDDFAWVYDVKVQGMGALLTGVDVGQLKMLVFFSSVAARTGNAGQSDYAAANEVLNRVAHSVKQRHPEVCVRSIGWGPWQGGMVSPELQRHFEARGIGLIPIQAGADVFVDELTDASSVEIVVGADAGLDDALLLERVSIAPTVEMTKVLQGHRFQAKVLVPMVQVLQWFSRFGRVLGKGGRLRDINVFNPLHLSNANSGMHIEENDGVLRLFDASSKPVYGATLTARAFQQVRIPLEEDWTRFMDASQIYDGKVLFHTDGFQVLNEVGVSDTSAVGSIQVSHECREMLEMDAGLQLALLWMAHCVEARSLPMSIDAVQWYEDAPVRQIRLVGHGVHNQVGKCDLYFLDATDKLVLQMTGVKVVALSGELA